MFNCKHKTNNPAIAMRCEICGASVRFLNTKYIYEHSVGQITYDKWDDAPYPLLLLEEHIDEDYFTYYIAENLYNHEKIKVSAYNLSIRVFNSYEEAIVYLFPPIFSY